MITSHLKEHFVFRPSLFKLFIDEIERFQRMGKGIPEVEVSEAIWNALWEEGKNMARYDAGYDRLKQGQMRLFGTLIKKEQK